MAVLRLYTNPKKPEKVTEIYQFKFKYTKEGATMDFDSSSTSFESGTNSKDIKKASVLLIRKLYILMQNLGPLPNDVILTMKLHYYNSVTPQDYQPPGFKEGVNSHFLVFDGEPVNLQVRLVSTGFHSMKIKVTMEAARVSDLEKNLFQENNTTEVAHQGLDCDDEEEEGGDKEDKEGYSASLASGDWLPWDDGGQWSPCHAQATLGLKDDPLILHPGAATPEHNRTHRQQQPELGFWSTAHLNRLKEPFAKISILEGFTEKCASELMKVATTVFINRDPETQR
ncbi:HORMA domain-containing protein 2-like [Urocitellus parryii]